MKGRADSMRRAAAVLLLVALTLAVVAPPAEACLECVALGLASFAVFTQLVSALDGAAGRLRGSRLLPARLLCPVRLAVSDGLRVRGVLPGGVLSAGVLPGELLRLLSRRLRQSGARPPRRLDRAERRPVRARPLRSRWGHGVSVPYAWVWIPNAAPNPGPAAPAAPVGPSLDGPEGSGGARNPEATEPPVGARSAPGFFPSRIRALATATRRPAGAPWRSRSGRRASSG